MAFVQIIEAEQVSSTRFSSSKMSGEQRRRASGLFDARSSLRDRTDPNRHLILAFFDSYEAAMENSNLAETSEFSEKQAALLDGPMTFQNFDVIEDRS